MSFDPRDPPDPHEGFGAGRPDRTPPSANFEYSDPLDPYGGPSERQQQAARGKVLGPAIFLLIAGVLNLLAGVYFVVNSVFTYNMSLETYEATMNQFQPENMQNMKNQGVSPQNMKDFGVVVNSVLGVLAILAGIVVLAGGACMLGRKMWGLCVTASILVLISPGGCCCMFGLVGGIWGLVALFNPDVRAGFR